MKKLAPQDYAYAVGKIRALERFLFTAEAFQQAQEADLISALQLFAESELYTDELLHVRDSVGLETLLDQELSQLKETVAALILDEPLRRLLDFQDLAQAQKIAQDYAPGFLADYLALLIDLHNIKTFLRLRVFDAPPEMLEQRITCIGFIPKKDFLDLYNQDLALFLSRLQYVHKGAEILDYSLFLRPGIEKAVKFSDFVSLEKEISSFLIQSLRPAKYFIFGPEPVLAYYWARANEINLIRLILLAKLNHLPADIVRERINLVYA